VGALGLLLFTTVGPLTVVSLSATMMVYAAGLGILYPTTVAAAIARHPHAAGAAAAVVGSAQMGFGMVGTALLSVCDTASAVPVGVLIAGLSLLALTHSLAGVRWRAR
jgi:hypothetical protein